MLGWELAPDQLGTDRPDVVAPIRNLYFVGHWTQPGGGITPVMVSAVRVADQITMRCDKHLGLLDRSKAQIVPTLVPV
jgi:phytoene dehydrogenase-like protein